MQAAITDASSNIVSQLLSHGLVGAFALVFMWLAWRKDQQVETLQNQRVADAKASADTMSQMGQRLATLTDQQARQLDRLMDKGVK